MPGPANGSAQPYVSIIVTCFNRAPTISRTLTSVVKQSFDDFEIVVIDDASTDRSLEVIGGFQDPRIRVIRHDRNLGAVAAYNSGLREARGELIAFLDSDDTMRTKWLERHVEALHRAPEIGIVWGWIRVHGTDGRSAVMYRNPFGKGRRHLLPTMLYWTPGIGTVLARRAVYDAIGPFDPEVGHMLDVDFAARFAQCGMFTVDMISEVLMDIYMQPTSLSGHVDKQHLRALSSYVNKYEDSLAAFPCVHARFLYRIGRVSELLGHEDADDHLRQAIQLCPGNLRYRAYPLVRDSGMLDVWNRISTLRTNLRGWYRNRRHGDDARQVR